MSQYACISTFGEAAASAPSNDPISYCLVQTVDNSFAHGAIASTICDKYNNNCQTYMAQYCATNDDAWKTGGVCDFASKDTHRSYPNPLQGSVSHDRDLLACGCMPTDRPTPASIGLTAGDQLLANAAARKYEVARHGGTKQCQPFDPTVASSPMVCNWSGGIPIYAVDPKTIDSDPVMNRLLAKPYVAPQLLKNIYVTMTRRGEMGKLKGTKLYAFFMSGPFQKMATTPVGVRASAKKSCERPRMLGQFPYKPCPQ